MESQWAHLLAFKLGIVRRGSGLKKQATLIMKNCSGLGVDVVLKKGTYPSGITVEIYAESP